MDVLAVEVNFSTTIYRVATSINIVTCFDSTSIELINPRRACAEGLRLVLCVCLCVCVFVSVCVSVTTPVPTLLIK